MFKETDGRSLLGVGVTRNVWALSNHPDIVIKLQHLRRLNRTDTSAGKNAIRTAKQELATLERYIPQQYLLTTKVKAFGNLWWIQQERITASRYLDSDVNRPTLLDELKILAQGARMMYKETGFVLDWFGTGDIPAICRMIVTPDYWCLPNIIVRSNQRQDNLKICDFGLVGRHINSLGTESLIAPISEQIGSVILKLLAIVEQRSGISFL